MGLFHNRLTHNGQHSADIDAVLVTGQRIKAFYYDTKVLLQFLQKGDIHLRFVVPQADHIALCSGLSDHFNGYQNDRCIAGLGTALALKPPQHTQSQIQCVGAVFFQGGLGSTVKALDCFAQFAFGKDGAQALVFKFRLNNTGSAHLVQGFKGELLQTPIRRLGQNSKVTTICQCVFQLVQGVGEDRQLSFRHTQVDKRITHTQVQQLSFPLHLFGQIIILHIRVNNDCLIQLGGSRHIFFLKRSVVLDLPTGSGMDTLG